jgi:PAS domain S-box-containing protein
MTKLKPSLSKKQVIKKVAKGKLNELPKRQSSQYERSLIEASLDPLVTISAKGKILDVNEASINVTGVTRQKLIGTNFSTYFTEPEKAQQGYLQAFKKGFVSDYPLTIKHRKGKLTDVLYNASVYKDDKGKVLGVFAAARDVTAQKWAKDLRIANIELAFQNSEKENRAAELVVANMELSFQNEEKEKRAAELGVANNELAFQNQEKEDRAAELGIANKELSFQNDEKEKRASELGVANKELAFQNKEKEKRAAELSIANKELSFQNEEKEKRAAELGVANKELQSFAYVSSHDLQEPLRKIQTFANRILEKEYEHLSDDGKDYFARIQNSANRMQTLIEDLLAFSRVNTGERKFEMTDLHKMIEALSEDFKEAIDKIGATLKIDLKGHANIIPFQFRQLMQNLVGNSLKFANPKTAPQINVSSTISKGSVFLKQNPKLTVRLLSAEKEYSHIQVSDNGIGFEPKFQEQVFEIFQKLHAREEYPGTGIGLAIVKKIVENHGGFITATSELGKGATFDIYIPV